ncbi:MAG: DUF362 domain-containing protein [Chloroflexi bacterium]|nr:DUF362 domain-containing protein [Chloroflexota bacterium]MBU1751831.1 DUF362 domain-containing protein [Chloroflexota bacterium]MBU1877390.1 DUF362 domain-containing protein [Chloroflexota bacterium]
MTVSIVRATLSDASAQVATALDLIGYRPPRAAVFIKPNVPDIGPPDQGLYTDPRVVEGLLQVFAGRPIVIGESTIVGRDTMAALERAGYGDLARRYGAELVDLKTVEREEVEWEFGTIQLPTLLRTHEYVNVAKMKTHIQTGVTLGLKNQKGLLRDADKRRFHRDDLHAHIRALGQVARPVLTVIDGIVALEGDGPWQWGQRKDAGLLLAGDDVMEVDNVCLRVMGFGPDHAPHIPPRDNVHVSGLSVDEARTPFAYDWPGYYVYRNVYEHLSDSCSGCNQALYRATKLVKQSRWRQLRFLYRGVLRRLDVLAGHLDELDGLPPGCGKVVCVGDCARGYAERHGLPVVRGCPPEPEDIVVAL